MLIPGMLIAKRQGPVPLSKHGVRLPIRLSDKPNALLGLALMANSGDDAFRSLQSFKLKLMRSMRL